MIKAILVLRLIQLKYMIYSLFESRDWFEYLIKVIVVKIIKRYDKFGFLDLVIGLNI